MLAHRDVAGVADARATTAVTGLILPNLSLRIDKARAVALATFLGAVALRALTRSIFLEVKFPLLENLIVLVDDSEEIMVAPRPIHSIEVKAIGTPRLEFLITEDKGGWASFIADHAVDGLTAKKVGVLQHKRIEVSVEEPLLWCNFKVSFKPHNC